MQTTLQTTAARNALPSATDLPNAEPTDRRETHFFERLAVLTGWAVRFFPRDGDAAENVDRRRSSKGPTILELP
jgi:hypothetical protein